MTTAVDIIVIGAGIAGASAAAEMAAHARVLLLEAEDQPGYHATGRSAAFFTLSYGNRVIRSITAMCESFFRNPPKDFDQVTLFNPRDCLYIARRDQREHLKQLENELGSHVARISAQQICRRVPILSADYVDAGIIDTSGGDLDVDALLQGYVRLFRRRGGQLRTGEIVKNLNREEQLWRIETTQDEYKVPIIVNAAGAWADEIAQRAGLGALGVDPKRRTAVLIDAPEGVDISGWPLVVDVEEEFYFKPDAGVILLSPADETPSPPCDAQPEELDVAIAVDRFEKATTMEVHRVNHRWAGLRTFAPDRIPVVGFDPRTTGFFWLAGQGGYGVMSAPGLAQLATYLVTQLSPAVEFTSVLDMVKEVSPERFLVNGR